MDAALWARAHERDPASAAELRLQSAVKEGGAPELEAAIAAAEAVRLSAGSPPLRKARALLAALRPDASPSGALDPMDAIFGQGYAPPDDD